MYGQNDDGIQGRIFSTSSFFWLDCVDHVWTVHKQVLLCRYSLDSLGSSIWTTVVVECLTYFPQASPSYAERENVNCTLFRYARMHCLLLVFRQTVERLQR